MQKSAVPCGFRECRDESGAGEMLTEERSVRREADVDSEGRRERSRLDKKKWFRGTVQKTAVQQGFGECNVEIKREIEKVDSQVGIPALHGPIGRIGAAGVFIIHGA